MNPFRTRLAATLPLAGLLAASLLAGCHHDEADTNTTTTPATAPAASTTPAGPSGPSGPAGPGGGMMSKPSTNPNGAAGDGLITAKVKAAIIADTKVGAHNVNVDTKSGVVVLRGNVKTAAAKTAAEADARKMQGVTKVMNQLTVNPTM